MCFCHERESKNLETAIQNGCLKTAHRSARIYCFLSEILSLMKLLFSYIGRSNNRTPRNLYTVNLAISGIMVGVFCVPTTMVQVLYGGWWHFGLFACKLVPTIQGKY